MDHISPALVKSVLRYEPETGHMYWLERDAVLFDNTPARSATHRARNWNSAWAGARAFTAISPEGYLRGAIFNKSFSAHRVAWVLAYGRWPTDEIDHINGIRSDNRLVNLREASSTTNKMNSARRLDNKSGVTGVHWCKQQSRWQAEIKKHGKRIHLGFFSDIEKAAEARQKAQAYLGFSVRHGTK
jgi:hypothetical protein